MTQPDSRMFEMTLEIDAQVDRVWKALTYAGELMRWFPLEARVRPGKGGSIWISWGPEFEAEQQIEIWEPNRRLGLKMKRWFDHPAEMSDAFGPGPGAEEPQRQIAIDYFLESRGGKTVLRLVHSGFGRDASWDDEFESISRGWAFELRGLRHYLERHAGRTRQAVWLRRKSAVSIGETWRRLWSGEGFLAGGRIDGLKEFDRYEIRTAEGETLGGIVQVNIPGKQFAGTIEEWNGAFFRTELDIRDGRAEVMVWLSAYDAPAAVVDAFRAGWTQRLAMLFPEVRAAR